MKNHLKILALLSILISLMSTELFAHGSYQVRNKCRWWQPKYKAHARVNMGPLIKQQWKSDCDAAISEKNNGCAYQYSRAANYGHSLYGSVFFSPWLCGRGLPAESMGSIEMNITTSERLIDEADVQNTDVIFSESRVSFEIKKARLMLGELGRINELRISLWQPRDDMTNFIEDTIRTPSKTLIEAFIRINPDLSVEVDNLPLSGVVIHRYQDSTVVFVESLVISWDLPNSINGLEDELAVSFESFGELIEEKVAKYEEKTVENSNQITLFPNPVSDLLTVQLADDLISHLLLLSIDGKVVNHWNVIPSHETSIDLNRFGLTPGYYILIVYSETRQYRQKFIFE